MVAGGVFVGGAVAGAVMGRRERLARQNRSSRSCGAAPAGAESWERPLWDTTGFTRSEPASHAVAPSPSSKVTEELAEMMESYAAATRAVYSPAPPAGSETPPVAPRAIHVPRPFRMDDGGPSDSGYGLGPSRDDVEENQRRDQERARLRDDQLKADRVAEDRRRDDLRRQLARN